MKYTLKSRTLEKIVLNLLKQNVFFSFYQIIIRVTRAFGCCDNVAERQIIDERGKRRLTHSTTPRVNFTNILQAPFTFADPKCAKRLTILLSFWCFRDLRA